MAISNAKAQGRGDAKTQEENPFTMKIAKEAIIMAAGAVINCFFHCALNPNQQGRDSLEL